MKMYPYVDNKTLLCQTWAQDISQFSELRINPTKDTGNVGWFICFVPMFKKKNRVLFF